MKKILLRITQSKSLTGIGVKTFSYDGRFKDLKGTKETFEGTNDEFTDWMNHLS